MDNERMPSGRGVTAEGDGDVRVKLECEALEHFWGTRFESSTSELLLFTTMYKYSSTYDHCFA